MTKTKAISLDDLNLSSACDISTKVDMDDVPMFEGKGISIEIVGQHSQRVVEFSSREINKMRAENANKRKKDGFKPFEEDIDFLVADAAVRIVGWSGIDAECTLDNAKKLCAMNAEARNKIVSESNNLTNFTKGK